MATLTLPNISSILAMDKNRAIGKQNQLPWHLPADLKHFKTLTTDHAIVMGRKTYASIGKPLPNRTNIILTRDPAFSAPGCKVVHSIEAALHCAAPDYTQEIFIIGGAEIYQQFLPYTQRIYLTLVHHVCGGDTFFPELDNHVWQTVERVDHQADKENAYRYSFLKLERIC